VIYEVTIIHPLRLTVTVRDVPAVEKSIIRGFLRTGWTIKATLDFRENGQVWGRIVECPDSPSTEGYYFALVYPSMTGALKTFGIWNLLDSEIPTPDPIDLPRYYVLEDWNSARWNYKVRDTAHPGTPAIMPVSSTENNWPQTDFCGVPVKWLNFWRNLLSMQMYGLLYIKPDGKTELIREQYNLITSKFKDLAAGNKAFMNGHGLETANPRFESLITCGNYVYELSRLTATGGKYKGKTMIMLLSFDVNDDPPPVTKETLKDPRVQWAKIVNQPKVPGQEGYLTNFPHLNTKPVPVPFLTSGRHWYPLSELRPE
jgi:hypothetical protein